MVKMNKNYISIGCKWKNEHKNKQISYCNFGVFTLYSGQNKEKETLKEEK